MKWSPLIFFKLKRKRKFMDVLKSHLSFPLWKAAIYIYIYLFIYLFIYLEGAIYIIRAFILASFIKKYAFCIIKAHFIYFT